MGAARAGAFLLGIVGATVVAAGGSTGLALGPSPATATELVTLTATEAAASPAVEVERVVARVDRTVITLSELLAEARLVLLRRGGLFAASRLELDPPGLRRVLDAVAGEPVDADVADLAAFLSSVLTAYVQRALLVGEARRLQLREVDESEIEAAYERLLDRGPDRASVREALEEMGFGAPAIPGALEPPPRLAATLRAELVAERLVDLRARSRAPLREEEVRACYAARAEALGRPGFEAARSRIEQGMRLARLTVRLAELIEQLEGRVEVRYAPPFEAQPLRTLDPCPAPEALPP